MQPLKIILILTCLTLIFPALSQRSWNTPTFNGKTDFKTIPINIGSRFMVTQYCDTSIAPQLQADTYTFEHSFMGKLKDVRSIYEMKRDTVENITIQLDNPQKRKAATAQADRQFGNSEFSKNNMLNIHQWKTTSNSIPISISLAYTDHEPTSEMLIKRSH